MNDREFRELRALEREFDDIPEGAASRVLAAVETLVGGFDGGGNDEGGGPGDDGNHNDSRSPRGGDAPGGGGSPKGGQGDAGMPNADGLGASTTAGTASGTSAGSVVSASTAAWAARAAYVAIGVAMGAGGHAIIARAPLPASTATASHVASSTFPTTMPSAETATSGGRANEPPEAVQASVPVRSLPSAPPNTTRAANSAASPKGHGADDERADLDVARAALGRGRPEACLAGLQAHQRKFGDGAFTEERESLWIQALAAAGRHTEASARAERFRTTYPSSLFGPAIERSLGKER